MIRCIAIDMDGTLLNSSLKISEENIEAIKQAKGLGMEIVIATGRSYPEADYILDEAGIECPLILVNGAEVRAPNGDIVRSNPLKKKTAKKILNTLAKKDIYVEFFTNKGIYTIDMEKGISFFKKMTDKASSEANVEMYKKHMAERAQYMKVVDSFDFLYEDEEYHIYKLLAFISDEQKRVEARKALKRLKGIAVSSSGFDNLEINSMNAQKGVALEVFLKEKEISLMETMAIGDNYNDLSMFERVGRSVAMGNADDAIKARCDHVTATNDESGVGKAILAALQQ